MTRGQDNVIPFNRPASTPAMLRCPLAASKDISEAIALMWELREQLRTTTGLAKVQRTRFDALGRYVEDRLERALHSMEVMA